MRSEQPGLSVVLQVGGERRRATACLESLLAQSVLQRLEILLLDYGLDRFPPLSGSAHPKVRLLARSQYEPLGTSRALAVREARAPVVAFIEDHCVAHAGWAEAILEAHAGGWKAIGCEVHSANPGVGISDAIAIMNYWRWLPPAREGVQDMLAGHNLAYDRDTLLGLDEPLEVLLRCDPVLQWVLQRKGVHPYLSPAAKIAHNNETEVSTIMRGYFHWNRVFAPTRAQLFGWTRLKTGLWILLSPLIPLSRISRTFAYFLRNRPELFKDFLLSLPVQCLAHSAAAAGQVAGLVLGVGDSETAFLRYELNQKRRGA